MQQVTPNKVTKPNKVNQKKIFETFLGVPFYLVLILLILVPLAIMILYSFQTTSSGAFSFKLTLEHYVRFFKETAFLKSMGRSLWYAAISTVITLIIAYPLAYIISRSAPKIRTLLILLINAPMWINLLLRTHALKQVIQMILPNLLGTDIATVIGMIYIYLPFMVIPIYTTLSKLDENLLEAASDLGANKLQVMTKVVIPLSISGIMSGILMVFLPAATTFVIPQLIGNNSQSGIGEIIERELLWFGNIGYGSAIAIVLSIIMIALIIIMNLVNKYRKVGENDDN